MPKKRVHCPRTELSILTKQIWDARGPKSRMKYTTARKKAAALCRKQGKALEYVKKGTTKSVIPKQKLIRTRHGVSITKKDETELLKRLANKSGKFHCPKGHFLKIARDILKNHTNGIKTWPLALREASKVCRAEGIEPPVLAISEIHLNDPKFNEALNISIPTTETPSELFINAKELETFEELKKNQ